MTPAQQPRHPLTTAELAACRRELEHAVAFFGRKDPDPAVRADLQARLADVLAERASRTRQRP
jgi:hypothetical protein